MAENYANLYAPTVPVSPSEFRKSRPMVVLTPVPRWLRWAARFMLWLDTHSKLEVVHQLEFIHFARWQVLRGRDFQSFDDGEPTEALRYDYFLFSTNYNGPWDQYIDAFSFVRPVARGLDHMWKTSKGFPGPWPLAEFKRYIHYHEQDPAHYYDAYPEASVRDISAASDLLARIEAFRVGWLDNGTPGELQHFLNGVAWTLGCIDPHGVRPGSLAATPGPGCNDRSRHLMRAGGIQKRPVDSRHGWLTAICPIRGESEDGRPWMELQEMLTGLRDEDSPFRACPMVHMARLQIINDPPPALGDRKGDHFRNNYLLFVVEFDGVLDDMLDVLHAQAPDFVREVFGRCQGYPEPDDSVYFRRYIDRCSKAVHLPYAAFDLTVHEVLDALEVKQRLRGWLMTHQYDEPEAMATAFRQFLGAMD